LDDALIIKLVLCSLIVVIVSYNAVPTLTKLTLHLLDTVDGHFFTLSLAVSFIMVLTTVMAFLFLLLASILTAILLWPDLVNAVSSLYKMLM